jgi:hypothetical protein
VENNHLPAYPVGITYIKKEDDIPEQATRPSSMGQKWSLCQAVTYARRHGWHVAMTANDNFCVPASAFHKWVDVSDEDLIESQVQQGWHKDRNAEQNRFNFFKGLFAGPKGEKTLQKMQEYIGRSSWSQIRSWFSATAPTSIIRFMHCAMITHRR